MNSFVQYLLYPNPPTAQYDSPKVIALLLLCIALIVGGALFKRWRAKNADPMLKKLSKSWSSAANWFGFIALVLLVARTEGISFVAMRILWVFWMIGFILFIFAQYKLFRMRYYKITPSIKNDKDVRKKYLPKRKK